MTTNDTILRPLLEELGRAYPWGPEALAAFERFLLTADDYALFRASPLRYARLYGRPERESIDLFLFAAKLGIMRMDWSLYCSTCGCIVENLRTLSTVHTHYQCEICAGETDASLDDYIGVGFTVQPQVRAIDYHDPRTLSAERYYFEYKHSGETYFYGGVIPEIQEQLTREFYCSRANVLTVLQPGATESYALEVGPDLFGVDESAGGGQYVVFVAEGQPESGAPMEVVLGTPPAPPGQIGAGRLDLVLRNETSAPSHILGINLPAYLFRYRGAGVRLVDVLLANRVLTTPLFKELFRHELIATNEGIGIRDITVLFTDLKGSTDLYDRVGDLRAFALVREHFDQLAQIVGEHGGVVVKTIGDAVMAAFISPLDGVRSAQAILAAIGAFNRRVGSDDIILKIGLHHGAAIAVTLNERLDYFGQTVNIAARVQGLADAEQICLTDSVYAAPGVAELLEGRPLRTERAKLKGVAERVTVYTV